MGWARWPAEDKKSPPGCRVDRCRVSRAGRVAGRVLTCEDGMSDSLEGFFRRFDEALAKWEREQSAPSLVELVREARHKQPSGFAIVQAAVDWELAGFDHLPHQRPTRDEDLQALFPT